jgi:hydroxymethylpyrimidine/phosphomethylpyrimidine kinase
MDVFFDGSAITAIPGERHPGAAAHGSGCTHSSALAAYLALGFEPLAAARRAKEIAAAAVRDGLRDVGAGSGPVDALGVGTARRWHNSARYEVPAHEARTRRGADRRG